jgi:hypothetical protein
MITINDTNSPEYMDAHAKRKESSPKEASVKTVAMNSQSNDGSLDLSCDKI